MVGAAALPVNSPPVRGTVARKGEKPVLNLCAVSQIPTPPPVPPSCSDCATQMQPAGGAAPAPSASRRWKSSDGKFRLDTPSASVISNPLSQQAILLDHVKKEATILPIPPAMPGAAPSIPGMGLPAAARNPPAMQVQQLGKSMIEGHEVEGQRFTLPPPSLPGMPAMPKMPGASSASAPGVAVPGAPTPPQMPKVPAVPSVAEVWTSVKLKTPVLTTVTTGAGQQTTYCKPSSVSEPHPSVFEIPPGYTIKPATPPKPPAMPKPPAPPKL
jgi:hypothetical protein